ncbi:MAG: myo-inositol-phosphate synthase [Herbinix sp.]|jgi:myo-inositol-1-phosphate synthase|nr:myo-inositol-phosphate synthase [Herbinix sp.]
MENVKKIRVAFAGVGSNTSSTVQTITQAKECNEETQLPGISYMSICGYELKNIDISCAFDVDENKIGIDVASAIFTQPTSCNKFCEVPLQNVSVVPGPLFDGLDGDLGEKVKAHKKCYENDTDDVVRILKETNTDVLVCNLPTGSRNAVRAYALASVMAGVAFVNATPEIVARDPEIEAKFKAYNVPLLGDDLRSHLGATTLHMALIELMKSRGINVTNTYQLNFGGNMDFYNLASPGRSLSKQNSKKNALFAAGIDASKVSAGPNGYVEYLGDTKICYLHLEGDSVLNSNITIELRLEVQDSPNAAGVIVNAIRLAMVARDRNMAGSIDSVSPYLFKSPRFGKTEQEGLRDFVNFIG